MALKILTELELVEVAYLNNNSYYKIKSKEIITIPSKYSIEFELLKYKKFHLTTFESLLRQIKLLQSIRSSGEEDKLIALIDKWENVSRDVIKELFNQQEGGMGSLKKFVKKLGLKYEDLGFDEESSSEEEEEEEEEQEENDENNDYGYNSHNHNNNNFNDKRIKYDD